MGVKINFTNEDIKVIKDKYENGLSADKIGGFFGVSKIPILRVLKDLNILKKPKSDGKKIVLTDCEIEKIKNFYLVEKLNKSEISKRLNKTASFIDKFLSKQDYRRSKSEATKISKTGVKVRDETKDKIRLGNIMAIKSGVKTQTGGVCQTFLINGVKCQGNYEKFYIEQLMLKNKKIPKNANVIETPYGLYTADFEFDDKLIEIKSEYTYSVLIGEKISRFTNKIETKQYQKIKWINENYKNVEIIVIDIRNNKQIIKKI